MSVVEKAKEKVEELKSRIQARKEGRQAPTSSSFPVIEEIRKNMLTRVKTKRLILPKVSMTPPPTSPPPVDSSKTLAPQVEQKQDAQNTLRKQENRKMYV